MQGNINLDLHGHQPAALPLQGHFCSAVDVGGKGKDGS